VSYSRALKWFLIILLPLTLVWKLPGKSDASIDAKQKIIEFLQDQHFDTADTGQTMGGMAVLHAQSGPCSMLIMPSALQGHEGSLVLNQTSSTGQVFFVLDGEIYRQERIWLAAVRELWSKFLRSVGLNRSAPLLIAVAATPNCNAELLPWYKLNGDP
jgi:hypothetical protein